MNNGYYLYEERYKPEGQYSGVSKKIYDQIDCFSKVSVIREVQLESKKSKVLKRIPFGSFIYKWDKAANQIKSASYIYIRKPMIDVGFRRFLQEIKKDNLNVKVLLEMPTYPYDKEQFFSSLLNIPFYIKETNNRKRLSGLVDRIVTYSEDDVIFGIPTIKLQNGIDVLRIPVVIPHERKDESIHLIAVASLQPYHGYERLFDGMREYYAGGGKRKIVFHVVGSGEIGDELKEIVHRNGIEENVIFYGAKTGDELTGLFNQADIGIGSFGFYKIGLDRASSLKTREYLARGLPVISGCRQDIFEIAPCTYHLEFPNDESPVNMQRIIAFYDQLFAGKDKGNVFAEIRDYAEKNVTMEKAFAPVIAYLNEELH